MKLANQVATCDFACLITDGSTDTAVIEQELVDIRFCQLGEVRVKFLGVIATPKADALGITQSIQKAVENGLGINFQEFSKKLVAMGTDGAAVMVGRNNGVVKKIQAIAPSVVGIHCFAHRLELAVKDVIKQHPEYAAMEKLLLDLWLFYKNRLVTKLLESSGSLRIKFWVTDRVLDVLDLVSLKLGLNSMTAD